VLAVGSGSTPRWPLALGTSSGHRRSCVLSRLGSGSGSEEGSSLGECLRVPWACLWEPTRRGPSQGLREEACEQRVTSIISLGLSSGAHLLQSEPRLLPPQIANGIVPSKICRSLTMQRLRHRNLPARAHDDSPAPSPCSLCKRLRLRLRRFTRMHR